MPFSRPNWAAVPLVVTGAPVSVVYEVEVTVPLAMVTLPLSGTCQAPRSTVSRPFTNTQTSSSPVKSSVAGVAASYLNQYFTSVVKLKLCVALGNGAVALKKDSAAVKPRRVATSASHGQPFQPYCSGTFRGDARVVEDAHPRRIEREEQRVAVVEHLGGVSTLRVVPREAVVEADHPRRAAPRSSGSVQSSGVRSSTACGFGYVMPLTVPFG